MKHYGFEISQFVDDELSVEDQQMLFFHLAECKDCREILSEYIDIKNGVKSFYNDMDIELKSPAASISYIRLKRNIYKPMFYFSAAALILLGFIFLFTQLTGKNTSNKYEKLWVDYTKLKNDYGNVFNEKNNLVKELEKERQSRTINDRQNSLKKFISSNEAKIKKKEHVFYFAKKVRKDRREISLSSITTVKITKEDFLFPQLIGN